MTKPKTENYDAAAERVKCGKWKVDPTLGTLSGTSGKPYRRLNSQGYVQVQFYEPGEWPGPVRTVLAHRVIYESVHGPLSVDLTVNHINGDHLDNRIENLEPLSQADNVKHAVRTGLYHANCVYCRDHGKDHTVKLPN